MRGRSYCSGRACEIAAPRYFSNRNMHLTLMGAAPAASALSCPDVVARTVASLHYPAPARRAAGWFGCSWGATVRHSGTPQCDGADGFPVHCAARLLDVRGRAQFCVSDRRFRKFRARPRLGAWGLAAQRFRDLHASLEALSVPQEFSESLSGPGSRGSAYLTSLDRRRPGETRPAPGR